MSPMAPSTLHPPVLDNYQAVVAEFCEFLTVAVHTILYERNIYPRTSFLSARKYNYPVRQNRHPQVCKWIQDAVAAVEAELLKGTISRTSLIIYSPTTIPLERFVFSTAHFPQVPRNEALTTLEVPDPDAPSLPPNNPTNNPPSPTTTTNPPTPLINLHSQFRALFARLSTQTSTLTPLPPHCTFTLAIELHERHVQGPDGDFAGQAPLSGNSAWIAAEPGLQPREEGEEVGVGESSAETGGSSSHGLGSSSGGAEGNGGSGGGAGEGNGGSGEGRGKERESEPGYVSQKGKYLGGGRTVPVRSVEAGPFVMEVWVEEGRGKAEAVREAERERELVMGGGGEGE
ncbi:hypothetical protein MMC17_007662 [Xylographa soralifera]|nr:hypothetical protein [Xylographa soralifera]